MNPSPVDRTTATYARARIGRVRGSRAERAELRKDVALLFHAPSDAALQSLRGTFERIQGRVASPRQLGYLIRCWRIHGPRTEQLLLDLYHERGTDQNLLLALELAPPAWLADEETGERAGAQDGHPDGADRGDDRRDRAAQDGVHDAFGFEQDDIPLFDPDEPPRPTERQEPGLSTATRPEPTRWCCRVGPDHVPQVRADGTQFCSRCHP